MDADIVGWTWYFHKTYLKTDDPLLRSYNGDFISWVTDIQDANTEQAYTGERVPTVHISHTGYWSGGVDADADSALYDVEEHGGGVNVGEMIGIGVEVGLGVGREGESDSDVEDSAPLIDTMATLNGDTVNSWGIGLWGVWEINTPTPHFDLQKGGVFRLIPHLG